MQKFRVRLGALAAAGATAVLVLAGTPALASTNSAGKTITGPEVVAGAVYGKAATANNPHIPLTLRGVVNTSDRGFVLGNGKNKKHGLKTTRGTLFVQITGKPTNSGTANRKTCRESFTQNEPFRVLGGKSTGAFAGASGPGAVQIYFAAYAPRYKSGPKRGKCNFNSSTGPARGAVARFLATIALTVR